MGCPGRTSTIRYTYLVFMRAFRANFFLSFPRKRLLWEKKDRRAVFGRNNDCV